MIGFHPQLDIDDFYVKLYVSFLLSFYLVIVLSRKKRNSGVFMWGREEGVFIYLFSIKVVDKPTKLCLASTSLKQWIIYWLYCVPLIHYGNRDFRIVLLRHLKIPDPGMMSTKLRYIGQGCKTTSPIRSFQKRAQNRFYNYPW